MIPNCELITANDVQFLVFKGNDLITNNLKVNGAYEPELTTIAHKIIGRHKAGTVLDIGANMGTFCIPLAKAFPTFHFRAFEPQRIVNYQLSANVIINGLENVYVEKLALSNCAWSDRMVVPDYTTETNIGAFSIDEQVRSNEYECATKGRYEEIIAEPLDRLEIEDFIALIKIDVEGHELEVLDGALETIRSNEYPPIIFEAWTWKPWYAERRKELFEFLQELGYEITEIGQNNLAQHPKHAELLKLEVVNDRK
jgi:FkbM family methyltransferase